ncbi:nucleotidyltransferase domain-containing protein [Kutzneria sp. CA-103260]|uniref:nucleotidyltransferase domain-containing protein n=1 Tax=Kutzneria sp. CA-103260 TaxID=2802641 RepID=UPI001BEEAA65|nr:nucleotidyltransferase domain-containing protein [Kutzneria sp. CA-103260]QUQ67325.1 hypothetical protein JJ691_50590 [Kutzneria sp. CA-103260]
MTIFTPQDRDRLLTVLIDRARRDGRISGAALTGSGALGGADRWSDIDFALGIDGDRDEVMADWTAFLYREHGVVHHMDVPSRSAIYRVFLLPDTLQVDIAFVPAAEFGATAPTFRLLFGTAAEQPPVTPPSARAEIDMAWLYALHVRSSIERGRDWQAEYMLGGLRNAVLTLMCLRHDVPASQGRGLHLLPPSETKAALATLVGSLEEAELRRAFRAAVELLLDEAVHFDADLAWTLAAPLRLMLG